MLAVLTGDLVNSSKMSTSAYNATIEQLNTFLTQITTATGATFELYRGDGYQIVFPAHHHAIRAMFEIKLFLNSQLDSQAVNCTQSLAYGDGEYVPGKPGISTGPVFTQSGRGLEKLKSGDFSVLCGENNIQLSVALMCQQLSYILNRLSKKQAALLYTYVSMDFPLHQHIAELEDTSRQNISERLKAAGADLLPPFIEFINAQNTIKDDSQT